MAKAPIQFTQNEKDTLIVGLSLALDRAKRMRDDRKNAANIRDLHQKNVDDVSNLLQRIDKEA
jgi:hypothetical protein